MASFQDRLNQIVPRLISEQLLANSGLGNEIGFYIFDYPPESELEMRKHVRFVLGQLHKEKPELRVKHINLFELVVGYLKDRDLLGRALQLQKDKGDGELLRALRAPLGADKIAEVFVRRAEPKEQGLVLISGVGGVWPLLRTHSVLNNLQPLMQNTPLVMFYPGEFTGNGLRLFGRLDEVNYYRAFRLVP